MLTTQLDEILIKFNNTATDYPSDKCIHQLFEEQVFKTPEAVALVFENQQLTYEELNTRANQLAHHLQNLGVKPEVLVGIFMERSLEMIVGLFGILKAGGAYLPLDPNYPQERLDFMLQDAQISVLVTQEKLVPQLPNSDITAICLDQDWETISAFGKENLESTVQAENLVYIIYTSGSTGQPKGVLITHRALCNLVTAEIQLFHLQPSSRVVQFASINFDVSVSEIFSTLCSGATLYLGTKNALLPGWNLIQFLQNHGITHVNLAPSVLAVLPQEELPTLEALIIGGEACSAKLIQQWASGRRFFNVYGPTEATVEVTVAECSPDSEPLIGRPIANTQVYILDESLQPVPIGVAGELHIGGVGLARGYLNRPELTQEKFIENPFNKSERLYKTGDLARYLPDGNIEYIGRIDHQVKIRGFRIELGEIETILEQHPTIKQAVAIAKEDRPGDVNLVAYIAANSVVPEQQLIADWRSFLKERLPDYMIPVAFVILETLPLTPNDKVDRKALAELPIDRNLLSSTENFVPPRNLLEEILSGIWADVLNIQRVGIHDNFLELGGNSLKAVTLCNKLLYQLGKNFPIDAVFEALTIAEFAAYLRETEPDIVKQIEDSGEINLFLGDDDLVDCSDSRQIDPVSGNICFPLSFTQQKRWAYQKSNPIVYFCGNFRRYRLTGELNVTALTESFNEIIHRHQPLRSTFCEVNGLPMQVIAPTATVNMSVINLQSLPEKSQYEEIERLSEEIRCHPFDLAKGPLMRVTLMRLGKHSHILLVHIHDILIDNSSFILFFKELGILYEAFVLDKPSPLPALPIQYADYVQWQQKSLTAEVLETKLNYWRRWLAPGEPPILQLPIHKPPSSSMSFGTNESFQIPAELTQKLKIFSQNQKTTLFMTALAAFSTLLYSYSGCEDIVIRAPHDNRNHWKLESLIGVISNVMMLRIDIGGNPSFSELLMRVRQVMREAVANQDVPFEQIAKDIEGQRQPSNSVFKAVATVFPESPEEEFKLPGLDVTFLEMEEFELRPDLELAIWEKKTSSETFLEGWWQYKKDLFAPETIAEMKNKFVRLLEAIVSNPEESVEQIHQIL